MHGFSVKWIYFSRMHVSHAWSMQVYRDKCITIFLKARLACEMHDYSRNSALACRMHYHNTECIIIMWNEFISSRIQSCIMQVFLGMQIYLVDCITILWKQHFHLKYCIMQCRTALLNARLWIDMQAIKWNAL